MGVDHRGRDVSVTEQLLEGSNVCPVLQEVGRERAPEGMTGRTLGDPSASNCISDGALHRSLVEVVTPDLAGRRVSVGAGRWKHPLPRPTPRLSARLQVEPVGQLDPTRAPAHVRLMLRSCTRSPPTRRSQSRPLRREPSRRHPLPLRLPWWPGEQPGEQLVARGSASCGAPAPASWGTAARHFVGIGAGPGVCGCRSSGPPLRLCAFARDQGGQHRASPGRWPSRTG